MRRSFKYRILPTNVQREKLERALDLLRDFYNAALTERREAWRLNHIRISCFDQINQIAEIRNSLNTDYQEVLASVLQAPLRRLDKAFRAFFRRVKARENPGYPRFKGKSFFNSIIYNRKGFRLHGNRLNMSLIGDLKIKLSRPIEGKIKEVALKREGSKWFAIISCDGVSEKPLTATGKQVGIDVGIESFATLSDGTHIPNWRFYERTAKRLRIAQRKVARRTKGSNRRRKAVAQLREIHQTIFNQRQDSQHKLSTRLIHENDVIAVEKLNVAGMCKGFLSKQIHDASWSSFLFMLSYKAESAGRKLIEVDPRNTSQTCTCGAGVKKKLSVRWHHCLKCGLSEHRDIVSAQIILSRGLRDQDLTLAVAPCVS